MVKQTHLNWLMVLTWTLDYAHLKISVSILFGANFNGLVHSERKKKKLPKFFNIISFFPPLSHGITYNTIW